MSAQPYVLRKFGIRNGAVMSYIWYGRQKVCGDFLFDPYANSRSVDKAMERDAAKIADWFNANRKTWTDEELLHAYHAIVNIQQGPSKWFEDYLRSELMPHEFEAAKSWAQREKQSPGCVDTDANEVALALRDRLLSIFWRKFDMSNRNEPINMIREFLVMAFYGPRQPGARLKNTATPREYIDL